MTRTPRRQQWAEGACYHLLNRGHNRQAVFADDEDRRAFLGLVARYRDRLGFRLYHYCLMTNHFHLLAQLRRPGEVSPLMAGLLRAYGHHYHRRHGFIGPLWQGRFKSPAVQRGAYLLSCGRYIERNPLEAGLVAEPWAYPWSSCRAGAGGCGVEEGPGASANAFRPVVRRRGLRRGKVATVDVKVYYLEMFSRPAAEVRPPRAGLKVVQARRPTVAYYRFLYDTVGKDYHWYSRGKLTDAELGAVLRDPLNEVHVLYVEGNPAGFVEFDRRVEGEVEVVQFGLMPEYIGQGLGRYFLRWALDRAWGYQPRRVWLHTCTLDHPAALPNYLKAGFAVYQEERTRREV